MLYFLTRSKGHPITSILVPFLTLIPNTLVHIDSSMAPSVYQELHSTKLISNGAIGHYHHETIASDLPSIPKPVLAPGVRVHKMALQSSSSSSSYSEHYSCRGDMVQETSSITTTESISTSISTTVAPTSLLSSLSRPMAVASLSQPSPSSSYPQPSTETTTTTTTTLEPNTSTTTVTTAPPSDLVQHCLLFPTYATRHSRSGTKKSKSQASFLWSSNMFLKTKKKNWSSTPSTCYYTPSILSLL